MICSFSARNRRKNGGGQSNANGGNDVFNVPKNIDVQLETSSVQVSDLIQLRFYAEYQWLLDFALYAIMVYTLTEVSLYQKTCQTTTTSWKLMMGDQWKIDNISIHLPFSVIHLHVSQKSRQWGQLKHGVVLTCHWIRIQNSCLTHWPLLWRRRWYGNKLYATCSRFEFFCPFVHFQGVSAR